MFASNHTSVWLLTRPVEEDRNALIGNRNLATDTNTAATGTGAATATSAAATAATTATGTS